VIRKKMIRPEPEIREKLSKILPHYLKMIEDNCRRLSRGCLRIPPLLGRYKNFLTRPNKCLFWAGKSSEVKLNYHKCGDCKNRIHHSSYDTCGSLIGSPIVYSKLKGCDSWKKKGWNERNEYNKEYYTENQECHRKIHNKFNMGGWKLALYFNAKSQFLQGITVRMINNEPDIPLCDLEIAYKDKILKQKISNAEWD